MTVVMDQNSAKEQHFVQGIPLTSAALRFKAQLLFIACHSCDGSLRLGCFQCVVGHGVLHLQIATWHARAYLAQSPLQSSKSRAHAAWYESREGVESFYSRRQVQNL